MENTILDSSAEVYGKPAKRTPRFYVLKYGGILLGGLLTHLFVFEFLKGWVPQFASPIFFNTGIILLLTLYIALLITSLKNFLLVYTDAGIFKLTVLGAAICFLPNVVSSIVRYSIILFGYFDISKIIIIVLATSLVFTLFALILSFFIAFQLKTRKTVLTITMIIALITIIVLVVKLFPALLGG